MRGIPELWNCPPNSNGLADDQWYLDVGSYLDGSDFFTGGFSPETMSQVVFPLPSDGREVFARLWYRVGEDWFFIDAQYVAHTAVFDPATPPRLGCADGQENKIMFTGEPYQIDNPYVDSYSNGFKDVVSKIRPMPIAAHIELQKGERSKLAEQAAHIL